MQVGDGGIKVGLRSGVKIGVDLGDLRIEGIYLVLVLILLGLVGCDGALDVLSLGLQGLVASLESSLVAVDQIDLVVEFDVVCVEVIDLLGDTSNVGGFHKDAS